MFTPHLPLAMFNNLFDADMIIIVFIGLLLFGNRLPTIGKSLGQTIVSFKKGLKETESEIESAASDTPAAEQTPAAPKHITATNPYRRNMPEAPAAAPRKTTKMISQSSEEI